MSMVAGLWSEGFLATATGWIVGSLFAVLFGALAYLYFEVAVALAMAAIGFVLASSLLVALGVTWSWVIVLVGVVVGVLLAVAAIMADLPMMVLTVLSALAGASVIVAGVMLLVGTIDSSQLGDGKSTLLFEDNPWWYAVYLVLAVIGVVAQVRSADRMDQSLRESWEADGGRQMRTT